MPAFKRTYAPPLLLAWSVGVALAIAPTGALAGAFPRTATPSYRLVLKALPPPLPAPPAAPAASAPPPLPGTPEPDAAPPATAPAPAVAPAPSPPASPSPASARSGGDLVPVAAASIAAGAPSLANEADADTKPTVPYFAGHDAISFACGVLAAQGSAGEGCDFMGRVSGPVAHVLGGLGFVYDVPGHAVSSTLLHVNFGVGFSIRPNRYWTIHIGAAGTLALSLRTGGAADPNDKDDPLRSVYAGGWLGVGGSRRLRASPWAFGLEYRAVSLQQIVSHAGVESIDLGHFLLLNATHWSEAHDDE